MEKFFNQVSETYPNDHRMTLEELNDIMQQGVAYYTEGQFEKAADCFKTITEHDSTNAVIWHNYGLCLIQLGLFEESITALNFPIHQGHIESYLSRGSAYRSLGRYQDALRDFASCLMADPTNAKALSNYGNSMREFGLPSAALPFFERALSIEPNDPTFRLNESVAHLLNGDFTNGWKNYDARWFYQSDASFKPNLPGDEYNGTQSIIGKIVCVYCEQGFGDSIQFVRYVKILQAMGAKIILITRPPLVALFEHNFPDVEIRTSYNDLAYHYHVPLMELPKCFNTTVDTVPYPDAYLNISNNLVQKYERQLGQKTKKRVGIVWSSNSIAFITRFRQAPLEPLLQMLSEVDCEIVNVEFDLSSEEHALLNKYGVKIMEQDGFDDTAAIIKTLDLMITVDTVYAHLAGSLGVPTYVMLADYGMDWRWFLNRTDSPFYNCVTLFRQHGDRSWLPVYQDIKKCLTTK